MVYRLECECGFESNAQLYGVGQGTDSYFVPVYTPPSEHLESLEICRQPGQSEDEFGQYLDTQIDKLVEQRFGPAAIRVTPGMAFSDSNVACPRCGNKTAKFAFTGIV